MKAERKDGTEPEPKAKAKGNYRCLTLTKAERKDGTEPEPKAKAKGNYRCLTLTKEMRALSPAILMFVSVIFESGLDIQLPIQKQWMHESLFLTLEKGTALIFMLFVYLSFETDRNISRALIFQGALRGFAALLNNLAVCNMNVGDASAILYMDPLTTSILESLVEGKILENIHITLLRIVLAFIGSIFVASSFFDAEDTRNTTFGIICAFSYVILSSIHNVIVGRIENVSALSLSVFVFIFGTLFCSLWLVLIVLLTTTTSDEAHKFTIIELNPTRKGLRILSLCSICFFSGSLYQIRNTAMQQSITLRSQVSNIMHLKYVIILFGYLAQVLIYNIVPNAWSISGCVLILISCILFDMPWCVAFMKFRGCRDDDDGNEEEGGGKKDRAISATAEEVTVEVISPSKVETISPIAM